MDPQEDFIQQRILTTYRDFYYETGRFPGRSTLIAVPRANMPSFINSEGYLSLHALYECYVGRDMQGLVSVQFLAAFNRFLGGDSEVSRNAMSEFFHNLSWQALTNDNDSKQLEFTAITELVKSINCLIQKKIYEAKKKTLEISKDIVEKLLSKEPETIKIEIEQVEENIVEGIVINDTTDYTPIHPVPVVKTEEEIEQDRLEWNKNFLKTELASRERDPEIIDDIEATNQVDLLRSTIDPSDGLVTNEEVNQTDYNRTEHNKPLGSQLDPNVLKVMKEIVKNMSEQVNSIYDDMPVLEDELETKYTPPEFARPNLQDILTGDITEDEMKQEIEELRQETGDILEDIMPEIFTDEPFDDTNFVRENIPELRSDQNRLDLDVRANVTTRKSKCI